jgi:restriction endonuclease S subunit
MVETKWKTVKMGDVCEIISGQSPEGKYYNEEGIGMPFYQGKTEFGKVYIKEPKKWTTLTTKIAIKDDILMSVRAPVGPVNISTQEICIGRGLAAIRPKENILNKMYVFLYLVKIEKDIQGTRGSIFDSINREQICNLTIPLPPLEVQKQIADNLENKLAKVDALKAALKAQLDEVNALPNSYLQKAFSGK